MIESKNLKLFIFSFAVSILAYSITLFNFNLSIDSEFSDNFFQTIMLGRWGHSFLREYILHEPFLPYFTNLTALVFLSLAAVTSVSALRISGTPAFVFLLLFVSYPQFAYQIEFINQSDTVAIGIFISSFSVFWITKKRTSTNYFTALVFIACNIFAIAIYQAIIIFTVTLYLSVALTSYINNQRERVIIKNDFLVGFAVLASVIIYYILTLAIQKHFNASFTSYTSSYLSHGAYDTKNLYVAFRTLLKTLIGSRNYGLELNILSVIAALVVIFKSKHKTCIDKITFPIIFLSILLAPYAFVIVSLGDVPARLFIGSSLGFALSISLLFILFKKIQPNSLALLIVIFMAMVNISFISSLFYSDQYARQQDKALARKIDQVITLKYPDSISSEQRIYFHGAIADVNKWKKDKSDIFGSSFFSWDGGNNNRIVNFMRFYNVGNYIEANQNDIKKIIPELSKTPSWPDINSVQEIDGVIVVKLGNETGWLPFSLN